MSNRNDELAVFGADGHVMPLEVILRLAMLRAREERTGSLTALARDLKKSRGAMTVFYKAHGLTKPKSGRPRV